MAIIHVKLTRMDENCKFFFNINNTLPPPFQTTVALHAKRNSVLFLH